MERTPRDVLVAAKFRRRALRYIRWPDQYVWVGFSVHRDFRQCVALNNSEPVHAVKMGRRGYVVRLLDRSFSKRRYPWVCSRAVGFYNFHMQSTTMVRRLGLSIIVVYLRAQ